MRAFRVTLPSGERYWTVVDHEYRVVGDVDEDLRHLRFGQDCAESTTKAYAESLALYLRWCERSERDWRTAAQRLGRTRLSICAADGSPSRAPSTRSSS